MYDLLLLPMPVAPIMGRAECSWRWLTGPCVHAGMMMGPRPMMPMPGMPYHMGMSMPMGSIPAGSQAPSMGIKASSAG